MIDPSKVCLFIPPELRRVKLDLFNRIGSKIEAHGGRVIRGEHAAVGRLPDEIIPIVGCTPQFRPMIADWRARGRTWIYWDRGYVRRVYATGLPRGADGGYYRWSVNAFQMRQVYDVPEDRWRVVVPGNRVDPRKLEVLPWHKGEHIVIAPAGGTDYARLHGQEDWLERTLAELKKYTNRRLIVRDKESKVELSQELAGAHALVTHASIAAVEAVIMGCPVFVDACSAASFVGLTDLSKIEEPIYPERQKWLHSLAYCQFNEQELVSGVLWNLIN